MNYMILGIKRVKGEYKGKNYDFYRLYVGCEIDKNGTGWENVLDDYHNKVKPENLPSVLGISSDKQLPELINRPCNVLFNRYGGIEKIVF